MAIKIACTSSRSACKAVITELALNHFFTKIKDLSCTLILAQVEYVVPKFFGWCSCQTNVVTKYFGYLIPYSL